MTVVPAGRVGRVFLLVAAINPRTRTMVRQPSKPANSLVTLRRNPSRRARPQTLARAQTAEQGQEPANNLPPELLICNSCDCSLHPHRRVPRRSGCHKDLGRILAGISSNTQTSGSHAGQLGRADQLVGPPVRPLSLDPPGLAKRRQTQLPSLLVDSHDHGL